MWNASICAARCPLWEWKICVGQGRKLGYSVLPCRNGRRQPVFGVHLLKEKFHRDEALRFYPRCSGTTPLRDICPSTRPSTVMHVGPASGPEQIRTGKNGWTPPTYCHTHWASSVGRCGCSCGPCGSTLIRPGSTRAFLRETDRDRRRVGDRYVGLVDGSVAVYRPAGEVPGGAACGSSAQTPGRAPQGR